MDQRDFTLVVLYFFLAKFLPWMDQGSAARDQIF